MTQLLATNFMVWSCEISNLCRCRRCLQQVKQEYLLVKNKLETLLRVSKLINNFSWRTLNYTYGFAIYIISFMDTYCSLSSR